MGQFSPTSLKMMMITKKQKILIMKAPNERLKRIMTVIGSAKRHLVIILRRMTLKKTKNIDHEGSKRKVKENHDSHQFSQREAFSDNTKKDDTKENNKIKNKDHEGSKRKVKENHDSHRISYKRGIINTIKNDDIEKRKKKIVFRKKP